MAEDNKKQCVSDEEFLRRLAIARAQQRQLQQQQQPARDPANFVDDSTDEDRLGYLASELEQRTTPSIPYS